MMFDKYFLSLAAIDSLLILKHSESNDIQYLSCSLFAKNDEPSYIHKIYIEEQTTWPMQPSSRQTFAEECEIGEVRDCFGRVETVER